MDETPEGKLLLDMQGAIAEYGRTKIAERTRLGKLYWAREGAMVGGYAPYGYRFVRRSEESRARLEVDEFLASVVHDMYRWAVEEHLSTRVIARRLTQQPGTMTARGASQWQPTAPDRIVRNPAYKGTFIYQRAQSVLPSRRLTADPYKQARKTGRKLRPEEDWISIPVPPIVDEATWEAAQAQFAQNSLHSLRNNKRHQFLLRGLIRCPRCGSTYAGAVKHGNRRYRCTQADPAVSSMGKRCPPGSIAADAVEVAVWQAVSGALKQPHLLIDEYQRRLAMVTPDARPETERKTVAISLKRVKAQEDRVTDAYINEVMELDRYGAEMEKLKERRKGLERVAQEIDLRERREEESLKALKHLEQFCHRVAQGLEAMTFEERQRLLRLVVERITMQGGHVRIETVIPAGWDGVQLRTRHPELVEGRPGI